VLDATFDKLTLGRHKGVLVVRGDPKSQNTAMAEPDGERGIGYRAGVAEAAGSRVDGTAPCMASR
jgi:hypothetical protein